ncbi:MAG: hypothetical protein ACKVOM_04215 [Ferruginibacter sp.]
MDVNILIQTLQQTINEQAAIIVKRRGRISVLENTKNSNNGHIPCSQDQNRPKKNQSLREPTTRKAGGQPGHKGTTLECSKVIDTIVKNSPIGCSNCGSNLSNYHEELVNTRQLIGIPVIALQCIKHIKSNAVVVVQQ